MLRPTASESTWQTPEAATRRGTAEPRWETGEGPRDGTGRRPAPQAQVRARGGLRAAPPPPPPASRLPAEGGGVGAAAPRSAPAHLRPRPWGWRADGARGQRAAREDPRRRRRRRRPDPEAREPSPRSSGAVAAAARRDDVAGQAAPHPPRAASREAAASRDAQTPGSPLPASADPGVPGGERWRPVCRPRTRGRRTPGPRPRDRGRAVRHLPGPGRPSRRRLRSLWCLPGRRRGEPRPQRSPHHSGARHQPEATLLCCLHPRTVKWKELRVTRSWTLRGRAEGSLEGPGVISPACPPTPPARGC